MKNKLPIILALLFLTACNLMPDFRRPEVEKITVFDVIKANTDRNVKFDCTRNDRYDRYLSIRNHPSLCLI